MCCTLTIDSFGKMGYILRDMDIYMVTTVTVVIRHNCHLAIQSTIQSTIQNEARIQSERDVKTKGETIMSDDQWVGERRRINMIPSSFVTPSSFAPPAPKDTHPPRMQH
eukprot:sb/3477410/